MQTHILTIMALMCMVAGEVKEAGEAGEVGEMTWAGLSVTSGGVWMLGAAEDTLFGTAGGALQQRKYNFPCEQNII